MNDEKTLQLPIKVAHDYFDAHVDIGVGECVNGAICLYLIEGMAPQPSAVQLNIKNDRTQVSIVPSDAPLDFLLRGRLLISQDDAKIIANTILSLIESSKENNDKENEGNEA